MENVKHKRFAPGNFFNFPKNIENPIIKIYVQKIRCSKMYIFGPQLCQRGLVWYLLNSCKACGPHGLDNPLTLIELMQDFCCSYVRPCFVFFLPKNRPVSWLFCGMWLTIIYHPRPTGVCFYLYSKQKIITYGNKCNLELVCKKIKPLSVAEK